MNVVHDHISHSHPGVRQQRSKKDRRGDADPGAHHPPMPSEVRLRRIENEMAEQKYDNEEHIDRAHALYQPRAQSGNDFSQSNAPAASSATARPPRFTAQALRRAIGKSEPTSTSINMWRVPANRWCASAQMNTIAAALNAQVSNTRFNCA